MQIAPKNLFRYHGDGAQWNAGLGEIVYKKLGWRTAALIGDDYSFPWTSAAGIIADFCGIGGRITKRVWTPPAGGDYAPFIRQLPRPNQVDGYFWLVGGANTSAALTAFEQAYGPLNAKQHSGNLFLYFLGANTTVAPRLVGAYMGGFGTFQTGGLKKAQAVSYVRNASKWFNNQNVNDGFFYNYWNAAWAMVQGLNKSQGRGRRRAAGGTAAFDQARLPGRQQRRPEARQPSPGDPGSVPAADHQGSRCGDRHDLDRGLRPERRPDVRRLLRPEQARPGPELPGLREAQAPVAGQDQGRQERRHHQPEHQVGR